MLEKPGKVLYINYRFCDGLEKPDKVQVIYLREKSLTGLLEETIKVRDKKLTHTVLESPDDVLESPDKVLEKPAKVLENIDWACG